MRKKLLSLIVAMSFLFIGALIVEAKAPLSPVNTVKMSKKFGAVNGIKLKKIESILKKIEAVNEQGCTTNCDCACVYNQIHEYWADAQRTCEANGWNSTSCDNGIARTLETGDMWGAMGCDTGPPGSVTVTVIARNVDRKIQMTRKEPFG